MEPEEYLGGFFQFPLCLLAQQLPFNELLNTCFDHGVCHYLDSKNDGREWRDDQEWRQEAMEDARKTIRFEGGSIESILATEKAACQFERWWQQSGRKTCTVRLRTDLYFDALHRAALSERELRVLLALYSAIGDKQAVVQGWQRIQWRAAGWLTKPLPPAQRGVQPCVGPLYPRGQIERTLSKLLNRKLVFCATYNRGERYWSNRLLQEGIWAEIAIRKTRSLHNERKRIDTANSAALYAKLHPTPPPPPPRIFPGA